MPYTPPSQRSPATSKPTSPSISRTHSYSDVNPSATHHAGRPSLPRSVSSTAYLQKHRRSPSISDNINADNSVKGDTTSSSANAPTVTGTIAPLQIHTDIPLIVVGTRESPLSSDDEDRERKREHSLAELQQALQSIELKRGYSPPRSNDNTGKVHSAHPMTAKLPGSHSQALTPEARKISHSRSSSELALSTHHKNISESPITTSDDSDADDEDLRMKPPLLRKKSGELVKPALRPSSRRRPSSMPGTPTFSKAVHFNDDIEQVRHFLQVDRPIAVSAGSSPVETLDSEHEYPFGYEDGYASKGIELELRLSNFPQESYERKTMPIAVERIFLSADNKTLIGNVSVANLAFNKFIVARFTLDYWKTTSEVVAEYNNDVRRKQSNDGRDRFNFNIKLADQANLESKTLLLCVRYNVNGQEFWDNNGNMNFQVDFMKKTKGTQGKGGMQGGSLGIIPRSKHSPPTARARTTPASPDDDFSSGFDSKYEFGPRRMVMSEPNPALRFKPKKRAIIFPDQAAQKSDGSGQGFSTRYDFGASLSAALSNAQSALGDRSGLQPKQTAPAIGNIGKAQPTTAMSQSSAPAVTGAGARPDTLSSEKPDLKSAEYNELIQKYCFFGSGKSSPQNVPAKPTVSDQAPENDFSDHSSGSNQDSGTSTPSPKMSPLLDGTNDQKTPTRTTTAFLVRSTSPGPITGFDMIPRGTSPIAYGNTSFRQGMHGGLFSEHTPTAILG
ncbi:carbohydrate-binding module family 21 protein [Aulographum hederae CBS 113979]|uniref:Carbohydrate-binding module family 21 protein n=1 Tax=Aulographum hederae CBS 113979 TaxID=1176131 RepID=A0A6G1GK44_9PEZI|nr:carbohydrate-binding module family 21 protein [Aulographum hederae CBS 113979]